jgi:hypothetical protein
MNSFAEKEQSRVQFFIHRYVHQKKSPRASRRRRREHEVTVESAARFAALYHHAARAARFRGA